MFAMSQALSATKLGPSTLTIKHYHATNSFFSFTGVQAINSTASDIEKLSPQLVSAAVTVRQTPKDTSCTEHLGQLRRDWTAKIHSLTSVVDDITDFNDFVLMSGMFNL